MMPLLSRPSTLSSLLMLAISSIYHLPADANDVVTQNHRLRSRSLQSTDPCTLLTESIFDTLAPDAQSLYSYAGFCAAVTNWNAANPTNKIFMTGSELNQRQEIAAFVGHTLHESEAYVYPREVSQCDPTANANGSTPWSAGTLYCQPSGYNLGDGARTDPYCSASHSSASTGCDCSAVANLAGAGYDAKELYFGRGPMQLSWNYNYLSAGTALGLDLCANPELVSTDGTVAWGTAIWFWMGNGGSTGVTCHVAIATNGDFGSSLKTINGGLECPASGTAVAGSVYRRLDYYCRAQNALGAGSLLSLAGCSGLAQRHTECLASNSCSNCAAVGNPVPTNPPTNPPSKAPTNPPTKAPTNPPTKAPTNPPTKAPTKAPTLSPTNPVPTSSPTTPIPTTSPSKSPTQGPSQSPSKSPSQSPSKSPTPIPTTSPSKSPTQGPSQSPSKSPSQSPSKSPTQSPTTSRSPSQVPSTSVSPTTTTSPSLSPTKRPTNAPTNAVTSPRADFWYPDYDTTWSVAGCKNTLPLPYPNKNDRPNYSTQLACCKGAYAGQMKGVCLSQLASPPTTSPTNAGGITDFWYPDYDTTWSVAGCKNTLPLPYPNKNDRPNYSTQLACCKGAYSGQVSGKCLSQLASPPTTSPTNAGGITDFWYPDYDTSWSVAGCKNSLPLPYSNKNDRPNYSTQLACCKGAYSGQVSGKCLSQLASPPTTSPTKTGGLDVYYPNYALSWPIGVCINNAPIPSGRPTYSTKSACCTGAYGGQMTNACMCAAEGVCYSCKCGTSAQRAAANGGVGCDIDCGTS